MALMVNTRERNRTIDFLKGICMLFIIVTHFSFSSEQRKWAGFAFWIEMAVPTLMIITGFLWACSYERKNIQNLQDCYSWRIILNRLLRFIVPFLFVYIIDVALDLFYFKNYSFLSYVYLFFVGGKGPGSYYFPVMIQLVFLFPLLYFLIKKHNLVGLLSCFILTFLFEVAKGAFMVSEATYRLLAFRYLFVVGTGCYLFFLKERLVGGGKLNLKLYLFVGCAATLIGITFLLFSEYFGWKPIILCYWTSTSFVASLTICFPISAILLFSRVRFLPLEFIGKASFNIYLVQMVFYATLSGIVYEKISNVYLSFLVCLITCVLFGEIFYLIESRLTKAIILKLTAV